MEVNKVPGYLWAVFSDNMERQFAEGFETRQQAKHWACQNLPKEVKYYRVGMYRNTNFKVIKFRENTNLQINEYRNNY